MLNPNELETLKEIKSFISEKKSFKLILKKLSSLAELSKDEDIKVFSSLFLNINRIILSNVFLEMITSEKESKDEPLLKYYPKFEEIIDFLITNQKEIDKLYKYVKECIKIQNDLPLTI